jgi:hypothetical protein
MRQPSLWAEDDTYRVNPSLQQSLKLRRATLQLKVVSRRLAECFSSWENTNRLGALDAGRLASAAGAAGSATSSSGT